MSKKRVLFVTQEMNPYTTISEISDVLRKLAPYTQGKGMEVRVLMPKYGSINERRHRLHEVVRLSGMNIIVDDDDFPLIIKVASLPGARLQVYFLDNEEFFKRKFVFDGEDEKPFEDNQERMVFFCKGVIETVKKFGWPPDIIHCHGWMSSLVPFYLNSVYKNDPIFEHSTIVFSAYKNNYETTFNKRFFELAAINQLEPEDLADFKSRGKVKLLLGGIKYADAIVKGSKSLPKDADNLIAAEGKPFLDYVEDENELLTQMVDFYKGLFEKVS
ncbi:MAG: glycogen/starch synthase [Saprospiraceae bacterium]|nr:glycogen/starch synthase [Bacteroidia bacterium]NNF20494.1 glycogen/starch synthase [Saprospiraceae bacterium]